MGYDYASYEEQIKQLQDHNLITGKSAYARGLQDYQQLTPVLTTVLYFGSQWDVLRRKLRYDTSYTIRHPEEFIDLLCTITKDSRYLTIKEQITTQRKDITMCAILDEWENYGRKRGIAQGRRQGKKIGEQHMLELASRMVQGGDSDLIPKLRQNPALLQEMYRKYSLEYTKV